MSPEDKRTLLGFQLDQLETEHYYLDQEMRRLRTRMFDIHEKIARVNAELEELDFAKSI